jgi:hypothetical protein
MEAFRKTLLAVIVGLIIILSFALYAIESCTTCPTSEGFLSFSVPRDIPIEYRDDVTEFTDDYINLGNKVCPLQNVVIDGIAKTLAGPEGKPNIAAAQVKAKAMANGQLFDCVLFEKQKKLFEKNDPTIKELYIFFDDIPDNIVDKLFSSAIFSYLQLNNTYEQVKSSISAATAPEPNPTPNPVASPAKEGFADVATSKPTLPERCKSQELCPEEMSKEIVGRLGKLKENIKILVERTEKPSFQFLVNETIEIKKKLDDIKKKAESGQLLPSPSPSPSSPPPSA